MVLTWAHIMAARVLVGSLWLRETPGRSHVAADFVAWGVAYPRAWNSAKGDDGYVLRNAKLARQIMRSQPYPFGQPERFLNRSHRNDVHIYRNTDARSVYVFTYRMLRCENVDTLSCNMPAWAVTAWMERNEGRHWFLERGQHYADQVEQAALTSYNQRAGFGAAT